MFVPLYVVLRDGIKSVGDYDNLSRAIQEARDQLAKVPKGELATFVVVNEDDYALFAATNRRIIGKFEKQLIGYRDTTFSVSVQEFDATDFVLRMDLKRLSEVQDESDSSDAIGLEFVDWDGPFDVVIDESICAFFGVGSIEEITPELLSALVDQCKPGPEPSQRFKAAESALRMCAKKLGVQGEGAQLVSELIASLQEYCEATGLNYSDCVSQALVKRLGGGSQSCLAAPVEANGAVSSASEREYRSAQVRSTLGMGYMPVEEDVFFVLNRLAARPATDEQAHELFQKLDVSLIQKAALFGQDLEQQTTYANEEIARQLREMGHLPPLQGA
jgi:hypothetical protein